MSEPAAGEGLVYVVDDDDAVRRAVAMLLRSVGLQVLAFDSAADFLAAYEPSVVSCILLDVRMPGMSGTEAQRRLQALRPEPVVVFISGHADVPVAVAAMKAGAVDFIQKPFNDQQLIDCIHRGLAESAARIAADEARQAFRDRLGALSPREWQVMERICAGKANKVIAAELGLSERTVEIHRANVMRKTEAGSLAELVRMSIAARDG